ncbi:MAG: hypothetical protein GY951_06785 [Psychromonas sp.]|nr:hypothetical protein [Psychromonas sp.]
MTLSQFSTEELQLDALDLVSDTLNSDHLSLLSEYIYSTNVEIQEEAFLRLSEIGVSESSVELFEYYLGHSSEWAQQDSTLALQQFYLRQ